MESEQRNKTVGQPLLTSLSVTATVGNYSKLNLELP